MAPEGSRLSRRDSPAIGDYYKEPVDIVGPDYLIESTYSAGPISVGAMGSTGPLSWSELKAWNEATKSNYDGWELETMRYLSQCYASMSIQARDKSCLPPHIDTEVRATGDEIKNAFRLVGRRK